MSAVAEVTARFDFVIQYNIFPQTTLAGKLGRRGPRYSFAVHTPPSPYRSLKV